MDESSLIQPERMYVTQTTLLMVILMILVFFYVYESSVFKELVKGKYIFTYVFNLFLRIEHAVMRSISN